jgi:hypothetical protein
MRLRTVPPLSAAGMTVLDDDKGNLKVGGKAAERDIVQFVQ